MIDFLRVSIAPAIFVSAITVVGAGIYLGITNHRRANSYIATVRNAARS